VNDTLAVRGPSARTLSPIAAGAFAVGTFALLVLGATATGNFDWTVPTLGEQIARATETDSVSAAAAATFDVSLIKGSTTLAEVVDATRIPAEVFTRVYGVPAGEQELQLKELKDQYGCSPGELREFVEAYRSDPAAAQTWVVGEHVEEEDQ